MHIEVGGKIEYPSNVHMNLNILTDVQIRTLCFIRVTHTAIETCFSVFIYLGFKCLHMKVILKPFLSLLH